jgi:hypothetical protein
MTTPKKEIMITPKRTLEQSAAAFATQIMETARRTIALQRINPGVMVRYRRCRKPDDDKAMIFTLSPSGHISISVIPFCDIVAIASSVPREEVVAWLTSDLHSKALQDTDIAS